jgi:hypothetical protein
MLGLKSLSLVERMAFIRQWCGVFVQECIGNTKTCNRVPCAELQVTTMFNLGKLYDFTA